MDNNNFIKVYYILCCLHRVQVSLHFLKMSKFSIKWNDFSSNVTHSFNQIRSNNRFSDVTLVGDDELIVPAHKIVITAGSKYFETILRNNQMSHQIICLQGIEKEELNLILDYLYNGEIKIDWNKIDRFLEISQRLKLHGLWNEKKSDLFLNPEKQAEESNHPSTTNIENVLQSITKSVIKPTDKDDDFKTDNEDFHTLAQDTSDKSNKSTEIDKSIKEQEHQAPFDDDEVEKEGGDQETRTLSTSSRHTVYNEELRIELRDIEFTRNDKNEPNVYSCKNCDKTVQQFYEAKWHYEKYHQNLDSERTILMDLASYINSMKGFVSTSENFQTYSADLRNKMNILKDINVKKLNPTLQIKHNEIKQWLECRVNGLHDFLDK